MPGRGEGERFGGKLGRGKGGAGMLKKINRRTSDLDHPQERKKKNASKKTRRNKKKSEKGKKKKKGNKGAQGKLNGRERGAPNKIHVAGLLEKLKKKNLETGAITVCKSGQGPLST